MLSSPDAQRDKLSGASSKRTGSSSGGGGGFLSWVVFFFGLIGKLFLAFLAFAVGVQVYKWWIMRQTNRRIAAAFGPGSQYMQNLQAGVFAVYGTDNTWLFAARNEREKLDWIFRIDQGYFSGSVSNSASGSGAVSPQRGYSNRFE